MKKLENTKAIIFETNNGTGNFYVPVDIFKNVVFLKKLRRGESWDSAVPLEAWEKSVVENLVKNHIWSTITLQ